MSPRRTPLAPAIGELLSQATGHRPPAEAEAVQHLWGGYGQLLRCQLPGGDSVIVKHVRWPDHGRRGGPDRSHRRKVRSYQVESRWYQQYAAECAEGCRVPRCLAARDLGDEVILVFEDLDAAGFPDRRGRLGDAELDACLAWLARFHATFLGRAPDGLWPVGTYWHLATRPDELAVLDAGPLRELASELDRRLSGAAHLTFVHGDAKVDNFCFSRDGSAVAAVDFQYVGGGCGMKDVAYFLSSCLEERECERREAELLARYFGHLRDALAGSRFDADAVEAEWRALYPLAWTDFYRFLQGWSPGPRRLHPYSERLAREVGAAL